METGLAGKHAVVTGASKGTGEDTIIDGGLTQSL
jgi:hypothetical protein